MIFWAHIANVLTAISIMGFGILGVIEPSLTFGTLLISAIFVGIIGAIGKFLDYSIEEDLFDED